MLVSRRCLLNGIYSYLCLWSSTRNRRGPLAGGKGVPRHTEARGGQSRIWGFPYGAAGKRSKSRQLEEGVGGALLAAPLPEKKKLNMSNRTNILKAPVN